MVKLIVGLKGSGKTKQLIEMVNSAINTSNGAVVCLEAGNKLRYDIKYQARLIDTSEYMVCDAQSLFGFVAGVFASNHDITDLFIDSALKICGNDLPSFEKFVQEASAFAEKNGINLVMTSSVEPEKVPDSLKKFL